MVVHSLFGTKIKLDKKQVVKQTKTIKQNNQAVYNLFLTNGHVLILSEPLKDFDIEVVALERVESSKSKEFTPYFEQSLPKAPPTSDNPLMISAQGKRFLPECAYRGEMVWTHKTAPEIRISKPNGQIIKDVDIEKMYKRR